MSRRKPSRSKRNGKGRGVPPRPIQSRISIFGSSLTNGRSAEYRFRRLYPLGEADIARIHQIVTAEVRQHRKKFPRFFFSIHLSVMGGLYQVKLIRDDEDERKWEHQWVSTPVTKSIADLKLSIDGLINEEIEFMLAGRPCWVLGFRVVFLRNSTRLKKANVRVISATPHRKGTAEKNRRIRH